MKKYLLILVFATACSSKHENSHNKSKEYCYANNQTDYLTQVDCEMIGGKFESLNEKKSWLWF